MTIHNELRNPLQGAENRFALVNNIAREAKKILAREANPELSNHGAIHKAMQQIELDDSTPPTVQA